MNLKFQEGNLPGLSDADLKMPIRDMNERLGLVFPAKNKDQEGLPPAPFGMETPTDFAPDYESPLLEQPKIDIKLATRFLKALNAMLAKLAKLPSLQDFQLSEGDFLTINGETILKLQKVIDELPLGAQESSFLVSELAFFKRALEALQEIRKQNSGSRKRIDAILLAKKATAGNRLAGAEIAGILENTPPNKPNNKKRAA